MSAEVNYTPEAAKFLTRPRAPGVTDDHPWLVRYGWTGSGVCVCCGSGLTRRVVLDQRGLEWGVDCYRAATGRSVPRPQKRFTPSVWLISPKGYTVTHPDSPEGFYLYSLTDGVPEALKDVLSADDQGRVARMEARMADPAFVAKMESR